MSRFHATVVPVVVFVFLCVLAQPAQAIIINYGDFQGTNVMYLQVTEDTRDEPMPLFGPPAILGDLLDFDPPSFRAAAGPNVPSKITDGQLNFTIMSNSNAFGINKVFIDEGGDYTLVGLGPAFAQATVGTSVRYRVTHVNGNPVGINCSGAGTMTFTPVGSGGNGDWRTPADNGTAVLWQGSFVADISALLASCNLNGLATKVEFVIDNTLTAFAANGGSAFIAKKDFSGLTVTIPEPSVHLAIFGLITCAVSTWRRRRSA